MEIDEHLKYTFLQFDPAPRQVDENARKQKFEAKKQILAYVLALQQKIRRSPTYRPPRCRRF